MGYKIKQLATIDGNTYAVLEMDAAADISALPDYTDGSVAYIVDDPDKMYLKISGAWVLTSKTRLAPGPHIDLDGANPYMLMQTNLLFDPRIKAAESGIASLEARVSALGPVTWQEIRNAVRTGDITNYLMVGDKVIVPHDTYGDIIFDVAAIDNATSAAAWAPSGYFDATPDAKPVTLVTQDCLANVQFSAPQANYKVLAAIPAGAANITLTSSAVASGAPTAYDLTVPEGGFALGSLLRIKDGATNKLLYYATPAATAVEVSLTPGTANTPLVVSPTAGAVLSAENHKDRVAYGSNNYAQSAIRQWLNSPLAKGTFYTPQSIYDLPPSWNATLDGFLKGMDVDFLSVIGATSRVTGNNTLTDGGGVTPSYTLTDRFFLPSRTEVGLGNENSVAENAAWPLFTSNAGRIKYLTGAARHWWLRSPNSPDAYGVRGVRTDGTLSGSHASTARGAAAACVIL